MKKFMNWMLTTILICGASVFMSCNGISDNPVAPVEPDLNVAGKIIGKWISASIDGQALPTNDKMFFYFVSFDVFHSPFHSPFFLVVLDFMLRSTSGRCFPHFFRG